MKLAIFLIMILMVGSVLAAAPQPKVRSINFGTQSIDLYLNNEKQLTSLPSFITNYAQFSYPRGLLITKQTGTISPELDILELKLNRQRYYTYLYFGANDSLLLEDENTRLRHGYTKIRFIHGDNTVGPVDIILNNNLVWENIAFKEIGEYQVLNAGRFDITVRDRTSLQTIATFSNELLNTRAIYTLVLIDGRAELKRDRQLWTK